jgi:AcrR family transcriptional regulator
MGNREALLLGAKRCLLTRGYSQTTARDIAQSAGVSLAAIGYHFRSKEALLTEALLLALEDWDKEFRQSLRSAMRAGASPQNRFEATWEQLLRAIEKHRPLWAANFELFTQIDSKPDIHPVLVNSLRYAYQSLAAVFLNKDESALDAETARTAGGFLHALLSGLIVQYLIDPGYTLSASELTAGMHVVAAGGARSTRNSRINAARRKTKPGKMLRVR